MGLLRVARLCGMHDNLLALHALPLDERRSNNRECARGYRHVKGLRQGQVVSAKHARQEFRFDGVLEFSGTNHKNDLGVEFRNHGAKVLDELICEDVLANTNEERTTKSL